MISFCYLFTERPSAIKSLNCKPGEQCYDNVHKMQNVILCPKYHPQYILYLSMAVTQVAIDTLYKTWLFALHLPDLRQLTDAVSPPLLSDQIANSFQKL